MSQVPAPDSFEEQSLTLTMSFISGLPKPLAEALRLAAIPYWYDAAILAVLRGADDADGRTPKIMDWLDNRSFVSPLPGDRYVINPDMRGLIRAQWKNDLAGLAQANRRLADYFAQRLAQAAGPEADELRQAHIYHLLAADGDQGVAELQAAISAAGFAHRLAVVERLAGIAAEQLPFLQPAQAAWVNYLTARSHQLHHRWEDSRALLQALLDRPDLPAALEPRVQFALAETLVKQSRWTRAVELYQAALNAFTAHGEFDEVAQCQLGLGEAYMDLGMNVWGQRESHPVPPPTLQQKLADLLMLPERLPILLYLLFGMRQFGLFTSVLTLARGVDWTVVRLFVAASRWFQHALKHMEAAHHAGGILRAKDSIARLYLAIGHLNGAAKIFREVVERTDIANSEYQLARARAWLGLSLLRQGQFDPAIENAGAAALVLADYQDHENAGRASYVLAQAQAARGSTDRALDSYAQALDHRQRQGSAPSVTNIAHTLETLAVRPGLAPEARDRARRIAATAAVREYPTRYTHPALAIFRSVSIVALAVSIFVVLYFAIQTETGVEVNASTAVTADALSEPSSSMSPVLTLASEQTIVPTFRANVAVNGIALSLLSYLVAYTLVGLYVLSRTTLRQLERGGRQQVRLDVATLESGTTRIAFAEATGLIRQDWTIAGQTHNANMLSAVWDSLRLPMYSQTTLLGPERRQIAVTGNTNWYWPLSSQIARRIPPSTPQVGLSTTLLKSRAGLLFIASNIFLAFFVGLGYAAPGLLSAPIPPTHYALADLRVLIYLGLLMPLVAWLVIAPLRQWTFARPTSKAPWITAAAGLALACVSFVSLGRWHVALGRPDIIMSLLAVGLVWIGGWTIFRAGWHPIWQREPSGARAYPAPVRWGALVVAIVITGLAWPLVTNELRSYDALLAGNVARNGQDYPAALAAYDLAIRLNPRDAAALDGQAAVYVQQREWTAALRVYDGLLKINPRQPAVWASIGMAHQGRAADLEDAHARESSPDAQRILKQQQEAAYREAVTAYTRAIELSSGKNPQFFLQRGAIYTALGQLFAGDNPTQARDLYSQALLDLDQVSSSTRQNADALNGLGWVHLKLAGLAETARDSALARQEYEQARDYFDEAVETAPNNANAYNGLGWTWLKLGQIQESRNNPDAAQAAYVESLEAYERASELEPDDAQYMVSLGNAKWLVSVRSSACARASAAPAERAEYMDLIQSAIDVMEQGVEIARQTGLPLRPSVAHYYRELGQLSYILYTCKNADQEQRLRDSIAYYDIAVELQPSSAYYLQMRGRITYILGTIQAGDAEGQKRRADIYQTAYQDLSASLALEPNNPDSLNWRAFIGSALARAQPDSPDGWARRETIERMAITDRTRLYELAADNKARTDNAYLVAVAHLRLGWTYYLQNKFPASIEMMDRGLAYTDTYATLHFVKGLAELARGNEATAAQSYRAGLSAVEKLPSADRGPLLADAIQDLTDLAAKRPALKSAADKLIEDLQAAR